MFELVTFPCGSKFRKHEKFQWQIFLPAPSLAAGSLSSKAVHADSFFSTLGQFPSPASRHGTSSTKSLLPITVILGGICLLLNNTPAPLRSLHLFLSALLSLFGFSPFILSGFQGLSSLWPGSKKFSGAKYEGPWPGNTDLGCNCSNLDTVSCSYFYSSELKESWIKELFRYIGGSIRQEGCNQAGILLL